MNKRGDVDKDMVIQLALVGGLILVVVIIIVAWNAGGVKIAMEKILSAMRQT